MKKKSTIILLLILLVTLNLTAYADSNHELFRAVELGDKGEVKDLLGGFFSGPDADVNSRNYENITPLMRAAYHGRPEIAEILIDEGAELDLQDDYGYTALMYASEQGNLETLKLLIDEGADANLKLSSEANFYNLNEGVNALMLAVKENKFEIVKELLGGSIFGSEIEVNSKDSLDYTPLMYALELDDPKIAKYLIDKGANVNTVNKHGYTPLIIAIKNQNLKLIRLLIENDADKYYVDKYGRLAFSYAEETNNNQIIELMKSK
jgi:ankyrin repeat protein